MWHLSIEIDRNSTESLTCQIQQAIQLRITEGLLQPGTRLPSTRQLAADLGVSRSVAVESYEQLTAEGYLVSVRGLGTMVAASPFIDTSQPVSLHEPEPDEPVRWDLRTGKANVTNFPRTEWLSCYRAALADAAQIDLDYPPVAGLPGLREALASQVGRVRGVRASRHQVMITAGFAQGLMLLCETLIGVGIRTLATEDPGHRAQRCFIENRGMRVVPVPVDEDGIDVDALCVSGAKAVLVTPAHQFPTGYTLSTDRRAALVRWAEDVDGLIIEDDYDGQFWYDQRACPPALQCVAPNRVIYAGTVSKSLIPALRLGWLVLPEHLVHLVRTARARHDLGTDSLTQLALARMIATGMLDRHLRRCRSRYRSRRELLVQALDDSLPGSRIVGSSAGLHAYVQLPGDVDETTLVSEALRRSVRVNGGRHYQFAPGARPPALVIGYSTLPLSALPESIFAISDAMGQLRRSSTDRRVPAAATRTG